MTLATPKLSVADFIRSTLVAAADAQDTQSRFVWEANDLTIVPPLFSLSRFLWDQGDVRITPASQTPIQAVAPHEPGNPTAAEFSQAWHAAVTRAAPLVNNLQEAYEQSLDKIARSAAARFTKAAHPLSSITAAGDMPKFLLPDQQEIYDDILAQLELRSATQPWRTKIADSVLKDVGAQLGISFDLTNPLFGNALEQMGNKITQITETQRKEIMGTLQKSWEAGDSIQHAAQSIIDRGSIMSMGRAKTIARTEFIGGVNGASQAAAQIGAGAKYKQWLATNDEHTREWHAEADGQVVPIGEPFSVDDEDMMYPGDPNGSAENVINCRCTLIYSDSPAGSQTPVAGLFGPGSPFAEGGWNPNLSELSQFLPEITPPPLPPEWTSQDLLWMDKSKTYDITPAQLKTRDTAIQAYTKGHNQEDIAYTLRSGKKLEGDAAKVQKSWDKVIKDSPQLGAKTRVYRGVKDLQLLDLEPGVELTDPALVSTTADRSVAENFSQNASLSANDPAIIQIDLPPSQRGMWTGSQIAADEQDVWAQEYVLPRDTTIHIDSIDTTQTPTLVTAHALPTGETLDTNTLATRLSADQNAIAERQAAYDAVTQTPEYKRIEALANAGTVDVQTAMKVYNAVQRGELRSVQQVDDFIKKLLPESKFGPATAEDLSKMLVQEAASVEPEITGDLMKAVDDAGGKMSGLKYRLKKSPSLAGKLERKAVDKGLTEAEYAGKVSDVLRYTGVFRPEDYAAGVEKTLKELKSEGYAISDADIENYWMIGDDYNGINAVAERGGYKFELQFHTPESLNLKMDNHLLYEEYRSSTNYEERLRLWNEMVAKADSIAMPSEDVTEVGTPILHPKPVPPVAPARLEVVAPYEPAPAIAEGLPGEVGGEVAQLPEDYKPWGGHEVPPPERHVATLDPAERNAVISNTSEPTAEFSGIFGPSNVRALVRAGKPLSSVQQKFMDTLGEAVDKSRLTQEGTTYRGLGMGQKDVVKLFGGTGDDLSSIIGNTVEDPFFASTSLDEHTAYQFTSLQGGRERFVVKISMPAETPALYVPEIDDTYKIQRELLLQRDAILQVTGVNTGKLASGETYTRIDVTVVPAEPAPAMAEGMPGEVGGEFAIVTDGNESAFDGEVFAKGTQEYETLGYMKIGGYNQSERMRLGQELTEGDKERIAILDKSFGKTTENLTTFRDFQDEATARSALGLSEGDSYASAIGKTITDQGYARVTTDPEGAFFGTKPVRIEINLPRGADSISFAKQLDRSDAEHELMLRRGSGFRITEVTKQAQLDAPSMEQVVLHADYVPSIEPAPAMAEGAVPGLPGSVGKYELSAMEDLPSSKGFTVKVAGQIKPIMFSKDLKWSDGFTQKRADAIAQELSKLTPKQLDAIQNVFTEAGPNPEDQLLAQKYGAKQFKSSANFKDGNINFYNGKFSPGALQHEAGHALGADGQVDLGFFTSDETKGFPNSWALPYQGGPLEGNDWVIAASHDMKLNAGQSFNIEGSKSSIFTPTPDSFGVTKYGQTFINEDWAESIRLYQSGIKLTDGTTVPFAQVFPSRAKILDEVFGKAEAKAAVEVPQVEAMDLHEGDRVVFNGKTYDVLSEPNKEFGSVDVQNTETGSTGQLVEGDQVTVVKKAPPPLTLPKVPGEVSTEVPAVQPPSAFAPPATPVPPTEIPTYEGLTPGAPAGGTTGARWATGPDGQQYIAKSYLGDQNRVASDAVANAIYRDLGVNVQEGGFADIGGARWYAAKKMPGEAQLTYTTEMKKRLGDDYMSHAYLNNRDFVGVNNGNSNILWEAGQPTYIDQGGSMFFKGLEGKKAFSATEVPEVKSMLTVGQAKGNVIVSAEQKAEQALVIGTRMTNDFIDKLVADAKFSSPQMAADVAKALKGRAQWMRDYAEKAGVTAKTAEAEAPGLGAKQELQELVQSAFYSDQINFKDLKGIMKGIDTGALDKPEYVQSAIDAAKKPPGLSAEEADVKAKWESGIYTSKDVEGFYAAHPELPVPDWAPNLPEGVPAGAVKVEASELQPGDRFMFESPNVVGGPLHPSTFEVTGLKDTSIDAVYVGKDGALTKNVASFNYANPSTFYKLPSKPLGVVKTDNLAQEEQKIFDALTPGDYVQTYAGDMGVVVSNVGGETVIELDSGATEYIKAGDLDLTQMQDKGIGPIALFQPEEGVFEVGDNVALSDMPIGAQFKNNAGYLSEIVAKKDGVVTVQDTTLEQAVVPGDAKFEITALPPQAVEAEPALGPTTKVAQLKVGDKFQFPGQVEIHYVSSLDVAGDGAFYDNGAKFAHADQDVVKSREVTSVPLPYVSLNQGDTGVFADLVPGTQFFVKGQESGIYEKISNTQVKVVVPLPGGEVGKIITSKAGPFGDQVLEVTKPAYMGEPYTPAAWSLIKKGDYLYSPDLGSLPSEYLGQVDKVTTEGKITYTKPDGSTHVWDVKIEMPKLGQSPELELTMPEGAGLKEAGFSAGDTVDYYGAKLTLTKKDSSGYWHAKTSQGAEQTISQPDAMTKIVSSAPEVAAPEAGGFESIDGTTFVSDINMGVAEFSPAADATKLRGYAKWAAKNKTDLLVTRDEQGLVDGLAWYRKNLPGEELRVNVSRMTPENRKDMLSSIVELGKSEGKTSVRLAAGTSHEDWLEGMGFTKPNKTTHLADIKDIKTPEPLVAPPEPAFTMPGPDYLANTWEYAPGKQGVLESYAKYQAKLKDRRFVILRDDQGRVNGLLSYKSQQVGTTFEANAFVVTPDVADLAVQESAKVAEDLLLTRLRLLQPAEGIGDISPKLEELGFKPEESTFKGKGQSWGIDLKDLSTTPQPVLKPVLPEVTPKIEIVGNGGQQISDALATLAQDDLAPELGNLEDFKQKVGASYTHYGKTLHFMKDEAGKIDGAFLVDPQPYNLGNFMQLQVRAVAPGHEQEIINLMLKQGADAEGSSYGVNAKGIWVSKSGLPQNMVDALVENGFKLGHKNYESGYKLISTSVKKKVKLGVPEVPVATKIPKLVEIGNYTVDVADGGDALNFAQGLDQSWVDKATLQNAKAGDKLFAVQDKQGNLVGAGKLGLPKSATTTNKSLYTFQMQSLGHGLGGAKNVEATLRMAASIAAKDNMSLGLMAKDDVQKSALEKLGFHPPTDPHYKQFGDWRQLNASEVKTLAEGGDLTPYKVPEPAVAPHHAVPSVNISQNLVEMSRPAPDWPVIPQEVRQNRGAYNNKLRTETTSYLNNLSSAKSAFKSYTSSYAYDINGRLRRGEALTGTDKARVKAMDHAMENSPPLPDGTVVWRVQDLDSSIAHEISDFTDAAGGDKLKGLMAFAEKHFPNGGIMEAKQYFSASFTPESYGSFNGKIVFEIKAKKGLYVRGISTHPHEDEFILPRDARYVVKGVDVGTTKGGSKAVFLQLEQVDESAQIVGQMSEEVKVDQATKDWMFPEGEVTTEIVPVGGENVGIPVTAPSKMQAQIKKDLQAFPGNLHNLTSIKVEPGVNPEDAKMGKKYGIKNYSSTASFNPESGQVQFYNGTYKTSTLNHELGHAMGGDGYVYGSDMPVRWNGQYGGGPIDGKAWVEASRHDMQTQQDLELTAFSSQGRPLPGTWENVSSAGTRKLTIGDQNITSYGGTGIMEDWAESVRLYLADKQDGYLIKADDGHQYTFAQLYPERAKILDDVFAGNKHGLRGREYMDTPHVGQMSEIALSVLQESALEATDQADIIYKLFVSAGKDIKDAERFVRDARELSHAVKDQIETLMDTSDKLSLAHTALQSEGIDVRETPEGENPEGVDKVGDQTRAVVPAGLKGAPPVDLVHDLGCQSQESLEASHHHRLSVSCHATPSRLHHNRRQDLFSPNT